MHGDLLDARVDHGEPTLPGDLACPFHLGASLDLGFAPGPALDAPTRARAEPTGTQGPA
jgi:hypothetical protein